MPNSPHPTTPRTDAKPAASSPQAARQARKRELMAQQAAKMGVRFVPAQVMREIYEREGLL